LLYHLNAESWPKFCRRHNYYRARFYAAQLGRFLSRDPIRYAGSKAGLYSYVDETPANRSDPSGLYAACWHQDAIFFAHGGRFDLPMDRSEGTVCGKIYVAPGTCPGDHVRMLIRYSAYDPLKKDCDKTALIEFTQHFDKWLYPGLPADCTVTGGEVVKNNIHGKECIEANWRVVCYTHCVVSPWDGRVCGTYGNGGNHSGSFKIVASFRDLTGSDESILVKWDIGFSDRCCRTTPCKAQISLAESHGPRSGRPYYWNDDFQEIDHPDDPPCPTGW
jgi:hypothetical protein